MRGLIIVFLFTSISAWSRPAEILLLRHGEKSRDGIELSEKGWRRAQALPALISRHDLFPSGAPVALLAMAPKVDSRSGQPVTSVRAIETLRYLGENLRLPVRAEFKKKQVEELAGAVMSDPAFDRKIVVICWEHKYLTDLAAAFGVEPAPEYSGQQFDRIWKITWDGQGRANLRDLPERLLPGDDVN